MKHKLIRLSSILAGLAFVAVFYGLAFNNTPSTNAISAMDFKAGNIIDDAVFYNTKTMTVEEIQAHLNRYMPACDTWGTGAVGSGRYINGVAVPSNTTRAEYAKKMRAAGNARYHEPPYVCVQNYYENPETHETLYETKNVIKDGMISAAQIIYDASQKYGINPQVLLVLLKKESYVWGDNWPLKDEYNTVMGYACPDTAPCNSKYFGFYNQVEMAAWQLNYYKEHIYSYNYRPYATNSILYSPTTSCGRKSVYLENIATTSLYIYTPYTPNDAALRNYPGTATCGSYGNRNFFMYFSEWFGSTHSFEATKKNILDGKYIIKDKETSKSVSAENNSKTAGAKFVLDTSNTSSTFSFIKNADDSYAIINDNSGLYLDITDSNAITGAEASQQAKSDANSQKWFIYSDADDEYYLASAVNPSYVLVIDESGKVILDVYGSKNSKPFTLRRTVAESERIEDGSYIIETPLKSDVVLDLNANSSAENTNITLYTANGTAAQKFTINYNENTGFYTIKTNNNMVLTAAKKPIAAGVNIQANSDTGSCTQQFSIVKDQNKDYYTIHSACDSKFVLDVDAAGTAKNTNVQLWGSNNTLAQRWILKSLTVKKEETKEEIKKDPETPAKPEQTTQPSESTKPEQTTQPSEPAQPTQPSEPAQPTQPSEPAKPAQLVADGNYYIHSRIRSNYVVDIAGASLAKGANIYMYTQNRTAAQIFTIKYNAKRDAYMFINPRSNHVIDLYGARTERKTNINAYTINNTCAQYWKIIKKGENNYTISSTCNTKYVLDVAAAGSVNKTNLQLYTSNGTKAQEWWFEKL